MDAAAQDFDAVDWDSLLKQYPAVAIDLARSFRLSGTLDDRRLNLAVFYEYEGLRRT